MVRKNYTVIIPTFNRASFLRRALTSVLNQTLLPSEIIVVDDGSIDNTEDVVAEFSEVTYIYKANGGVSSARNEGIKRAKYEYIAFLDSDDEWHQDKMYLQLQSESLVTYTDEVWIRDGKEIKIPKKFHKKIPTTLESEIEFCNIAPSSIVIHKSVLDDIGNFDEDLEVCEDYDLWLRILLKYPINLVDQKLTIKYAGHEDQLSFKYWGMDRFRVRSLEKLYQLSLRSIIREVLLHKYRLLLKGFEKNNRTREVEIYKKKIEYITVKKREEGDPS